MLTIDCCTTCVCMTYRAFPSAPQNLFCQSCETFAVTSGSCWNDSIPGHSAAEVFCSFCISVLRNLTPIVQTAVCFCSSVLLFHFFVAWSYFGKHSSGIKFVKKKRKKEGSIRQQNRINSSERKKLHLGKTGCRR